MKCLKGLCTFCATAIMDRQLGFVQRFTIFVTEENNNNNVTSIHCIIHQEALCAKVTDFSDTLSQVKQMIIYIWSNALQHRQSGASFDDSEESLEDTQSHC